MTGHQPKKTCSNCLHLYNCKHIKPKKDCSSWQACLPPPPPNTGSSVQNQKPAEKKQILVIRINKRVSRKELDEIKKGAYEGIKEGCFVVSPDIDVYNVTYEGEIEIKTEES